MDNIFILDKDKIKRDVLSNYGLNPISPFYNDTHTIYLKTGAETVSFDTFGAAATNGYLSLGNYIMFKYGEKNKLFQIMTMETEHGDDIIKNCYCETVGLELRNHVVRAMTIDGDVNTFFNTILINSPFKLGYVEEGINEVKSVKIDKPTGAYQLIQDNLSTFNIEIEFTVEYKKNRVVGQIINVYRQRGKETNIRFEYGENVDKVKKSEDLTEFCTALVGVGANGVDFKNNEWSVAKGNPVDKPLNQDFVADMEAFNFKNNDGSHILGIFEGTSENGADLLLETWNELQRIKNPKIDYEFNIAILETDEVGIGDTIYCIDNDYNPPLHLSARVSELQLSYTDPKKNKCILSNYKEVKSKIKTISFDAIKNELVAYINDLKVGVLTTTQINQLKNYMKDLDMEESEINSLIEELRKIAKDKFEDANRNIISGTNVDILCEKGKNYICSRVKSMKFRLKETADTDFRASIKFTTEKDTEPTKFYQSNICWLSGTDCVNGALIPKADTTYTMNLIWDGEINTTRKYSGTVTGVRGGGSYSTYTNKTDYTSKIVECMKTYYDNRSKFIYNTRTIYSFKDPTTIANQSKWQTNGKFHIDCSTFAQLVTRGITYINSTYNHPEKSPYYLSTKYKYPFIMDATISDVDRFAADQARYFVENGMALELDPATRADWKKLQVGDFVFWSKRLGEESAVINDRYMQVGHVAIVSEVLSDGDVMTYEVTSVTGVVLNRKLSTNYPEKLLFFARPRR